MQQLYESAQLRVGDVNGVQPGAKAIGKICLKRKVLLCDCVFASDANVIIYNWISWFIYLKAVYFGVQRKKQLPEINSGQALSFYNVLAFYVGVK